MLFCFCVSGWALVQTWKTTTTITTATAATKIPLRQLRQIYLCRISPVRAIRKRLQKWLHVKRSAHCTKFNHKYLTRRRIWIITAEAEPTGSRPILPPAPQSQTAWKICRTTMWFFSVTLFGTDRRRKSYTPFWKAMISRAKPSFPSALRAPAESARARTISSRLHKTPIGKTERDSHQKRQKAK